MHQSTIRIRGHAFAFARTYTPGHQLSAAEAAALESLRCENIRNNISARVAKHFEGLPPGSLLPDDEKATLDTWVQEYANGYRFPEPRVQAPKLSELETMARQIAQEYTQEPEAQARLATEPEVLALARQRVEVKRRVLLTTMGDL
jgi:hypothetical protein